MQEKGYGCAVWNMSATGMPAPGHQLGPLWQPGGARTYARWGLVSLKRLGRPPKALKGAWAMTSWFLLAPTRPLAVPSMCAEKP